MKVLIACEESQEVCKAFRALGHEARKEYFERLKKTNEIALELWEKRLKNKTCCNQTVAQDKCNYYGAAILYCEDAIRALEMMDKEENRDGKTEE